ncbi:hypothetical protein EDC28_10342 [Gallaecimonas pentaromativorans]|uniref:Uncharacterized protein n=2 Tax=Gallaecimonas pentaromativorans TaxID=584787 RepID=A0A3N1PNK3_9GAMM|nr:hypothetical protein EDC28_10342 [Gallaecimonas pentaromativorans]
MHGSKDVQMNRSHRHSLHRAKPLSVGTLAIAIGITLVSLLLPLLGLPDWLPLLGAALSATLVYWVLNNPAEEFLIVQQGQLRIRPTRSRRLETVPLAQIRDVRPVTGPETAELEVQCLDGKQLRFQAFYGQPNEDELSQLEQFLRRHLQTFSS